MGRYHHNLRTKVECLRAAAMTDVSKYLQYYILFTLYEEAYLIQVTLQIPNRKVTTNKVAAARWQQLGGEVSGNKGGEVGNNKGGSKEGGSKESGSKEGGSKEGGSQRSKL